jgi:hypothetical protein
MKYAQFKIALPKKKGHLVKDAFRSVKLRFGPANAGFHSLNDE